MKDSHKVYFLTLFIFWSLLGYVLFHFLKIMLYKNPTNPITNNTLATLLVISWIYLLYLMIAAFLNQKKIESRSMDSLEQKLTSEFREEYEILYKRITTKIDNSAVPNDLHLSILDGFLHAQNSGNQISEIQKDQEKYVSYFLNLDRQEKLVTLKFLMISIVSLPLILFETFRIWIFDIIFRTGNYVSFFSTKIESSGVWFVLVLGLLIPFVLLPLLLFKEKQKFLIGFSYFWVGIIFIIPAFIPMIAEWGIIQTIPNRWILMLYLMMTTITILAIFIFIQKSKLPKKKVHL